MSGLQKTAIVAGFALALMAGFWAGQDFGRFDDQFNRCIAAGGDAITRVSRRCFKRQMIELPLLTPDANSLAR